MGILNINNKKLINRLQTTLRNSGGEIKKRVPEFIVLFTRVCVEKSGLKERKKKNCKPGERERERRKKERAGIELVPFFIKGIVNE